MAADHGALNAADTFGEKKIKDKKVISKRMHPHKITKERTLVGRSQFCAIGFHFELPVTTILYYTL